MSLIVFQSQVFWRLYLHSRSQGLAPWCGIWTTWSSGRRFTFVRSLLMIVGCHMGAGVAMFGETVSLPLLPTSMCPFYHLLWRSCSASFQVFFRGNCFICICRFGVFMGRGEFRFFVYHLWPCPWLYFKLLEVSIYQNNLLENRRVIEFCFNFILPLFVFHIWTFFKTLKFCRFRTWNLAVGCQQKFLHASKIPAEV